MSGKLCDGLTSNQGVRNHESHAYCQGRAFATGGGSLSKISGTTGVEANDNGITWTAVQYGTGNHKIFLQDPGAAESALAVSVEGQQVFVSLETEASADIETGVEGNDNAITWSPAAADGRLRVALVDPGDITQAPAITVTADLISVSLATDGAGAITSTATEVQTAVEGDGGASALATVADTGASDGSGVVTAETGSTGQIVSTGDEVKAAVAADSDAAALMVGADTGGSDGTGVVVVESTALSGTTIDYLAGSRAALAYVAGFGSYNGGVGTALAQDCCADPAYDGV